MSLEGYLEEFLLYLASEKGAAQATLESYGRDLKAFHHFLEQDKIASYGSISENHILRFLNYLQENNYASSSVRRALVSIKVFFRFLKREDYIPINPAKMLNSPKQWQTIPEVFSEEEITRILEIPDPDTFEGARDRAIMELLYGAGLRVSELCQVKIEDFQERFLRILGKGSKERLVPIGTKAELALALYKKKYRNLPIDKRGEALFISRSGRQILREQVWSLVKKYAKLAGVTKRISPHSFRHTYATHLLSHKAEVRVIQELLGHADISSTDRYTHVNNQQLIDAFKQFHPRN